MMPVYSAMHDVLNLDSFTIFLIVVITILVYFYIVILWNFS